MVDLQYEINAPIEIVVELAHYILTRSQELLVQHGSVDTGFLLRSGKIDVKESEGRVIVSYDAPYAEYVEFGTPPHPISPRRLFEWARRKLNLTEKQARSASFAIANKIRKEGIDPKPYLRPALEEAQIKFGI